jgi:hypothetical protein
MATMLVTPVCTGPGRAWKALARSPTPPAIFWMTGSSVSPACTAEVFTSFHDILTCDAVVSYRFAASSASAVFCSHAASPLARDSRSMSPDAAMFSRARVTRMSDWPRSSRVENTSPPDSFIRPRPSMKSARASAGSAFQLAAKSSAETPATLAKPPSVSDPVLTDLSMSIRTLEIAEPPASASMPDDASALPSARTFDSDRPTIAPAPAMFCAIWMIWVSVDAPLLPRSTSAAPRLSTSSGAVCMTFISCAMLVDAASAVRSVDSPRSAMTDVNERMSSVFTPSAPAFSAICASSMAVVGLTADMSCSPCSIAASCAGVPSTVLVTPAQADSQSIADLAAKTPTATMPVPTIAALFARSSSAAWCSCAARIPLRAKSWVARPAARTLLM